MSRPKVFIWSGGITIAAMLCYFFPLFRITVIDDADAERNAESRAALGVSEFVNEFWNTGLPDAFSDAVEIGELFEAVDRDPVEARHRLGRQLGLGGACFFFVRGAGCIEEVAADHCVLRINERAQRARIETGVIVGNTIRDSTGLIDVNQFANSQDFNNLSAELNQKVETEVIRPALDQLRVGVRLRFVGCAQVDTDGDFDPLCIVPVHLESQAPESIP